MMDVVKRIHISKFIVTSFLNVTLPLITHITHYIVFKVAKTEI